MKTMAWMTFVLTLALASINLSRGSLDQQARNLSSVNEVRVQGIVESATAVAPQAADNFRQLQKALAQPALRVPAIPPSTSSD